MIITLCGSARFEPWFHAWNEALSLAGHCVFGLAAYPSMHAGEKNWYTPEQKATLDAVHKSKIERSAAILVLNAFAYMGISTMSEVKYARELRRETYFLESWGAGCGIGPMHTDASRAAKERFGIPADCMSPMDTSECASRPSAWHPNLLGMGGESRSAILRGLHAALDPVIRAGDWGASLALSKQENAAKWCDARSERPSE